MIEALIPDWPAPGRVKALVTTRDGGVSPAPYGSLNLAAHVGDDPAAVARNRALLKAQFRLPEEPRWLTQVHGCGVIDAAAAGSGRAADAIVSDRPGEVCAVLTADCLPLLLADRDGERVCAVHAGWRGLAAGVVEAAVARLGRPGRLLAWLGPAIGADAFEVGEEVRQAFLQSAPEDAAAFRERGSGRWLADIYALARRRLTRLGVGYIGGGGYCTLRQEELFYSYRREGVTGRMAALIWLDPHG